MSVFPGQFHEKINDIQWNLTWVTCNSGQYALLIRLRLERQLFANPINQCIINKSDAPIFWLSHHTGKKYFSEPEHKKQQRISVFLKYDSSYLPVAFYNLCQITPNVSGGRRDTNVNVSILTLRTGEFL